METLGIRAVLPSASEKQHFLIFLVSSGVLVQGKYEVQSHQISLTQLKMIGACLEIAVFKTHLL